MEEWKEYRLIDVLEALIDYRGKTPRKTTFGIPLITAKIIKNGRIEKPSEFISVDDYDSWMVRGFPKVGDVVLTTEAPLGEVAQLNDNNIALAQRVVTLRGKSGTLDNTYLKYYFLSRVGQQRLKARETGTTVTGIKQSELKEVLVDVPPYEVQKRIASILSSLDDKIEVNRRINENLEQQAQALFKSWFVDFEPFKDGEFVESEWGMIPKGWRVGKLEEMCSFISRGLTPKYDDGSDELILGQTCVRNNIVTLNNARKHKPKNKTEKWVQQWDVLLNSTGIGSLGRVGIVYFQKNNVAIDSHITVVRTSNPLYRHYVGRNLLNRQLEIEKMAVGSTGQTELPRDSVKAMPIVIPFDKVMKRFNCIIEPMALAMYRNIEEDSRLASLRDTLLPRLMSGEIRVDEINVL